MMTDEIHKSLSQSVLSSEDEKGKKLAVLRLINFHERTAVQRACMLLMRQTKRGINCRQR